mmetsp:Transcript_98571/g.195546  ORF Transcript_98571/g.195546 Transcript_98571/m.195546 type:complete len:86 (+) Transcript_98571:61-318(+)
MAPGVPASSVLLLEAVPACGPTGVRKAFLEAAALKDHDDATFCTAAWAPSETSEKIRRAVEAASFKCNADEDDEVKLADGSSSML